MKTLEKILIILMTFIIGLSSCSKESDNDCSDRFCLDTLSNIESELTYYPVIDVHQHIYKPGHYYQQSSHNGLLSPATADEHFEAVVNNMQANNVVIGLAGNPITWTKYCYDNYGESNHMFRYSFSYYDYNDLKFRVTSGQVSEAVRIGHIASFGELGGVYQGIKHNDSLHHLLYAIADSFSLPVLVHSGVVPSYMLTPKYEYNEANPASLKPVLEKWPNVNFCAAHFAISNDEVYDFDDETFEMMANYKNFYVDLSPLNWWDDFGKQKVIQLIERSIEEGVIDKVLYGSDEMQWPNAITESIMDIKNAEYLTTIQKKKILYWNAADFLKLSDEEVKEHFAK